MPIPAPAPPATTDEVVQTRSPFELRLNGVWVTLEGVIPGVPQTMERARSEFESVDGHRFAQQAPRGNREWSLDWQYATPAAVAAIALAAEAPGDDVWLWDGASAVANMLDPRDCYGHDSTAPVLDCGGVPLRAISVLTPSATCLVRGGASYTLGMYANKPDGTNVAVVTYPGGTQDVDSVGAGLRTEIAFSPTVDGTLQVGVVGSGFPATGLQLVEGDLPPTWLAGERTPCKVSVADPSRTLNLLRSGSRGRSDYSVTLREVG